jgi:hypothetical protein
VNNEGGCSTTSKYQPISDPLCYKVPVEMIGLIWLSACGSQSLLLHLKSLHGLSAISTTNSQELSEYV